MMRNKMKTKTLTILVINFKTLKNFSISVINKNYLNFNKQMMKIIDLVVVP